MLVKFTFTIPNDSYIYYANYREETDEFIVQWVDDNDGSPDYAFYTVSQVKYAINHKNWLVCGVDNITWK